jgi:hypothetical protein
MTMLVFVGAYLLIALGVALTMRSGRAYRLYAGLIWPFILCTVIAQRADEEYARGTAWQAWMLERENAPNRLDDSRGDKGT